MKRKKGYAAEVRKLRAELFYHLQLYRADLRAVRAGRQKIKEITGKLRSLRRSQ